MQLSLFIGKQVLTPAGENLGYVLAANPTRDFSAIASFLCADGEEEEYSLPAKSVLFSSDALIATRPRLSSPTGVPCPLGKAVFSHTGELLGTLNDLLLGDEPLFLVQGEEAELTFPLSRVSIGDAIMVYPEGEKPAAPPAAKKKTPQKSKAKNAVKKDDPPAPVPFRTQDALNRVNLLGRKLKKNVYDENGFLIAEAGERITESTVSKARRCNRLLQLTVNTLTNVI